jgi:hypothetical protein
MNERPRFAIVDDDGDEPVAPKKAAAPEPFDARDLSRRAVAAWGLIAPHLYDRRGFANDDLRRLGPDYVPLDPSRPRPAGWPRVVGLHGPSPFDARGKTGAWVCIGYESGGAHGDDVVDLVVFLSGGASRRVAADALSALLDRVVIAKAAS